MNTAGAFTSQLLESSSTLKEALFKIAFLQKREWPLGTIVTPVFRLDGFSFVQFVFENGEAGKVGFAPLFSGNHCVLKEVKGLAKYDFYDKDGDYLYSHEQLNFTPLYVETIEMEPDCVFVSHLYNILCFEYEQAKKAEANVERIKFFEDIVNAIAVEPSLQKWVSNFGKDRAFDHYNERLVRTEHNAVLRYTERQELRKKILKDRKTVVDVKARAHSVSASSRVKGTFFRKVHTRARIVSQRPIDVVKNIAYQYTFGVLFWFIRVVRGNIGYSIALAVYGPFTFYFITQPMNPHAMWAVGKVRSASIEAVDSVKQKFSHLGLMESAPMDRPGVAVASSTFVSPTPVPTVARDVVEKKQINSFEKEKPRTLGILVSGDIKSVAEQSWSDRMSNFKDMQIGYEESLQFSERMGRLEQMESQLNFPLIAESAYRETERYLVSIDELTGKPLNPKMTTFLENERTRTLQTQLYIWDRLVRCIFDHPFVMMDSSNEQMHVDYYMGRSFLFLRELTDSLMAKHKTLQKPKNFTLVEKLAEAYSSNKVEKDSIEERLKQNSLLATQKEFYSTQEMRSHVKRQWEILFLLQNKAQEAANFGMQTYTWSVRNAIWVLQSLYANKDRDLHLMLNVTPAGKNEVKTKIEPLYESLFHILTMEFVSIKSELGGRLNNDIDSLQRKVIIEGIKDFFSERDSVIKSM